MGICKLTVEDAEGTRPTVTQLPLEFELFDF
jgi:hypothetical protein